MFFKTSRLKRRKINKKLFDFKTGLPSSLLKKSFGLTGYSYGFLVNRKVLK